MFEIVGVCVAQMFIPSELGYGDSGSGSDIGGGDVLVFTMEIVKLEGPGRPAEPKGPPPFTDLEGKVASFREVEAKVRQSSGSRSGTAKCWLLSHPQ